MESQQTVSMSLRALQALLERPFQALVLSQAF
jgi:hypothetical protein